MGGSRIDGFIRLAANVLEEGCTLAKVTDELMREANVTPTSEQIAERCGKPMEALRAAAMVIGTNLAMVRLDAPMGPDCDGTLAETVGAEDDHLHRQELWEGVERLRRLLPDDVAIAELRAVEGCDLHGLGELLGGIGRTKARHRFNESRERLRVVGGRRLEELLTG